MSDIQRVSLHSYLNEHNNRVPYGAVMVGEPDDIEAVEVATRQGGQEAYAVDAEPYVFWGNSDAYQIFDEVTVEPEKHTPRKRGRPRKVTSDD